MASSRPKGDPDTLCHKAQSASGLNCGVMLVGATAITHVQIPLSAGLSKVSFRSTTAETLVFVSDLHSLQHFHQRNCCSVLGWVGEDFLST